MPDLDQKITPAFRRVFLGMESDAPQRLAKQGTALQGKALP